MPKELGATALPGEKRRWSDYVIPYKFKDRGQPDKVRPFGLVWTDFRHAVETKTGKIYYEFCHAWDIENECFFEDREARCACCKLNLSGSRRYFMNVIVMDLVEQKPANPPADWTPVRMMEMALSLYKKITESAEMNRGVPVTHPEKGAVLVVKFDDSKEPANKYSAGVDEKAYSLTDNDLSEFLVVQKYPGGKTAVIRGNGSVPGGFEYIRVVNTRDDMVQSLKRQGYFETAQQETVQADIVSASGGRAALADVEFDIPIQEANEHVKRAATAMRAVVVEDEAPPPKSKPRIKPAQEELDDIPFDVRVLSKEGNPSTSAKTPVAKGSIKKTETPNVEALRAQKSTDCPTDFGRFVSAQECYLSCPVLDSCRGLSEKDNALFKKPVQNIQQKGLDFDDDTL